MSQPELSERAIVHLIDAGDLQAVSRDAALAALLAEGWTLLTQFAVSVGDDRPERVALVLAPPRQRAELVRLAQGLDYVRRWGWVAPASAGALCAALAALAWVLA